MMLQGLSNMVGIFVNQLRNIKEAGKIVYLAYLYVVETLADIWIAFCMMYRDVDKMPFSDYFWQSKLINSPNKEEMMKLFKFHLICDLRSKQSTLIGKSRG